MSVVPLTKMHGTLNDFVVVDERTPRIADLAAFGRFVCDRRAGIGADGLLVILPSQVADARMRIVNADGSEAEMCGNGMRCVARYLSERGEGERLRVETIAGIIASEVVRTEPQFEVRLNMGVPQPRPRPAGFPGADSISMGNPHVVIFDSSLDAVDLVAAAAALRDDPAVAGETNVHVAVPLDPHTIAVRHYERGAGFTFACGTGAVASAAAAILRGLAASPVDVHVPGGRLRVDWGGEGDAFLTGPAVRVFDTQLEADDARA